jgi:hypothetical protein
MTLPEKFTFLHDRLNGIDDGNYTGSTPGIERLNIPAMLLNDGP